MTTAERNARILALRRQGLTMSQIAAEVGITKNAVVGVLHRKRLAASKAARAARKAAKTITRSRPTRTLDWRCDALHARMDAVLAETAEAIGRCYTPPERKQ